MSRLRDLYKNLDSSAKRLFIEDVSARSAVEQENQEPKDFKWMTDLPDDIFHHILTYVERPTDTGPFLMSTLALVCKDVYKSLEMKRDVLWDMILHEYTSNSERSGSKKRTKLQSRHELPSSPKSVASEVRRHCKRLRRTSVKQDVMAAHQALCIRTEAAIVQLAEMTFNKQEPLTLGRLRKLLRTPGPNLRINQRARFGTTILLECCNARYTKEQVIRRCVLELVNHYGADPNIAATEGDANLSYTPLFLAAGRAMPLVVEALLDCGANPKICGSSRFPLYINPKRTFNSKHLTPLDLAVTISQVEQRFGPSKGLIGCFKVIEVLRKKTGEIGSIAESQVANFEKSDLSLDIIEKIRKQNPQFSPAN